MYSSRRVQRKRLQDGANATSCSIIWPARKKWKCFHGTASSCQLFRYTLTFSIKSYSRADKKGFSLFQYNGLFLFSGFLTNHRRYLVTSQVKQYGLSNFLTNTSLISWTGMIQIKIKILWASHYFQTHQIRIVKA